MIRLQSSLIKGLQAPQANPASVCAALQQAVKLEHATIPPYLYALYSLDTSENQEIATILQSVVTEEMLHMTLASNVLNALGGSSEIGLPGFIPSYPGPLPGGVESDLVVNLAPFSMTQLAAFLQIESPEDPHDYPKALALGAPAEQITIGQFYEAIGAAIVILGDDAFAKPPRNQIGPDLMPESVIVSDVATALQAIKTIVEQGEGTKTTPDEVVGSGYAHYYRYMQIQKGNLLVQKTKLKPQDPGYSYSGAPVPFNAAGVYAVPTNPTAASYPVDSAQRFACDNFNYTYTSMLLTLGALFNGENSASQFDDAIGLMMSLKSQARAMMSGIPNPAVLTGPSFEYQAVNPGDAGTRSKRAS